MSNDSQKSFTLLELLIVIAVIAILAAIVIVSLSDAQQRAKEARGMNFSQNIRTTLSNDLLGKWDMDEVKTDANGDYIEDTSGNGNKGYLKNGPILVGGKVRGALKFDYQNDYVDINNSINDNFENGKESTVEAWVYYTGGSNPSAFHSIWGGIAGYHYFSIYDELSTIRLSVDTKTGVNNGRYWWYTSIKIPKNEWTHIVSVFIASKYHKIYINGEEWKATLNLSSYGNLDIPPTNNARMGHSVLTYPTHLFDGLIDEVRIYKSALTAKQIKQLYAEGKNRHLTDY